MAFIFFRDDNPRLTSNERLGRSNEEINISGSFRKSSPQAIIGNWSFRFTDGSPAIEGEFKMPNNPVSWTALPHDSATGRYTVRFEVNDKADEWLLDLFQILNSKKMI